MAATPRNLLAGKTPSDSTTIFTRADPTVRAGVVLLSGMVAAALAADAVGLMALALRLLLVYGALLLTILAAWPAIQRNAGAWATLLGGIVLGAIFLASASPTSSSSSSVFAVSLVLAAVACSTRGSISQAALWAGLAACALGCFRLADAMPATWLLFDRLAGLMGVLAGWAVGRPLWVGETFAGVDVLVLSGVVVGLAVHASPPPTSRRICWAVVAIVFGHFAYLAALVQSDKLLALLPEPFWPSLSTENQVGLWTWGNFLRSLIPWHLPLFALLIHLGIAAGFSWPVFRLLEEKGEEKDRQPQKQKAFIKPASGPKAPWLPAATPAVLIGAAVLLCSATGSTWSLHGRTILAFSPDPNDWTKPQYDATTEGDFGLLSDLVESLGGKFIKATVLKDEQLQQADVLLLLPSSQSWPASLIERIRRYVREGGSLLLAAAPADVELRATNNINQLLEPTAIRLRRDTAAPRTLDWEEALRTLPHPATVGGELPGRRFGFHYGSSPAISFPARALLLGKWGWSDPGSETALFGGTTYEPGERLGDIVLAAETVFGRGRIILLGDATVLHDETLAESYGFVAQLLGYLAYKSANPQSFWRQAVAIALLAVMLFLVFRRRQGWTLLLAGATAALVLMLCRLAAEAAARPLPDGRAAAKRGDGAGPRLAYIDVSHGEAFSRNLWAEQGVAGLLRTLIRHGCLPLFAPALEPDRLERAEVLFLIGPAAEFSPLERERLKRFVISGGTLIVLTGAEHARPSASLLEEFRLRVPYSPVLPGDKSREPAPLGAFAQLFGKAEHRRYVQFYAAWPVEYDKNRGQPLVVWSDGKRDLPVVVVHEEGQGQVVLIGDTFFACNANLEDGESSLPDNIRFWRWLLSQVLPGEEPWEPPPRSPEENRDRNDSGDEAEEDEAP